MKPLLIHCVAPVALLLIAISPPAEAGHLEGRVSGLPDAKPLRRVPIRAYALGRSVAVGMLTENDGSFVLRNLDPGEYALCVPPVEGYRAGIISNIRVRDNDTTRVEITLGSSVRIDGDSWLQSYASFQQSFTATGLGLVMTGMKGFGPGRVVSVSVLDGDGPEGKVIGPERLTEPLGHEDTKYLAWGGGEIQTVPGQRYTLDMKAAAEGSVWVPGVAGRGDVYAGGSAYFDGVPRPTSDLGVILCEDNDGIRTSYSLRGGGRARRVRSVGQQFKALSRNIILASAHLANVGGPPVYVRFSIHKEGSGGSQVGPSKVVPVSETATVAWGADEVPVKEGQSYYLHIEGLSGDVFLAAVQPDTFAEGASAFNGQTNNDWDICATVAGMISASDFQTLMKHPRHEEVIELTNASFEQGESGWSRKGDMGQACGSDEGLAPMWGRQMFGWTARKEGEGSRTLLYQQVNVQAGRWYNFSGSVYTDHIGGRSSDVKIRLVAAPQGALALTDYDHVTTSQWYATEGQWVRGSVEFQAQAETITVGFDLEQRWSLDSSSLYVDGAHLEQIGAR